MLLLLLNITDLAFTLLLLGTGFYREANGLMVQVVANILASILVKVVLPFGLLTFMYYRMQKATETQLKRANYLINGILIVYAGINVFHLAMLSILPIFLVLR